MDTPSEIADPGPPGDFQDEPSPDAMIWHRGWVVAMVAAGAALLATVGSISARVLLALAFMALPGLIGALWRPRTEQRLPLLVVWTVGAVLAVCVTGGLSGPLAVLCVTPVIVCLVIEGAWRAGAGLSIAAALICAAAAALHITPRPPAEPTRMWLTLIAVLIAAAAAGGALLVARRRAEDDRDEVEAELSAFQALMGDLPELALAMDAAGRTEAVFGQPLDGVNTAALHKGLVEAAVPADRPKLDAAIVEALNHGSAQTAFASVSAPDQRIVAALQRTHAGGVTAILRKASPPTRPAPFSAPVVAAAATGAVSAEVAERLAAAETGRRDAELGRDRAEAVATARARFLANMSHELRTPLNAIMGFSDMMRAKMFGELPPKYAEYAELIHESGGHLLDLINDVLDMSKIEAQRYTLSREVFDVRDALNASLRLMRLQAGEAGVKLRAVLPATPLMIDADKRAIKQIALNLLSNALKFTPRDGTVILSSHAAAGLLEIVVADTGMGIAADDLKRLGQPFEQAGGNEDRARGSGLGLSLVDAFAKLHGGTLTIESRLGEGTAATVRIPVLAVQAETPALEPAPVAEPVPEPADAKPEPVAEALGEPPSVEPAPLETEPALDPVAPSPVAAAPEPPAREGTLADLGPLDGRKAEHHGLRQMVLGIFTQHPPGPQPASGGPSDGPGRPNNSGVRILS